MYYVLNFRERTNDHHPAKKGKDKERTSRGTMDDLTPSPSSPTLPMMTTNEGEAPDNKEMGSVVHDKIARDICTVTIENAQNGMLQKTAQDICKSVVQNAKEKVLQKSARDVSKVAIDNAQIRILRETACDLCRTALETAQKSILKETTRDMDVAYVKESSVSMETATAGKKIKASLQREATLASKKKKSGLEFESKANTSYIAPSSEIIIAIKHTRASISQERKIISPPPMLPFNKFDCTRAITKKKKTYPTFEPGLAKTGMPIVIIL